MKYSTKSVGVKKKIRFCLVANFQVHVLFKRAWSMCYRRAIIKI